MKNVHPVADYMYSFFYQFLSDQKGLSSNSILAYRDAIKLLLCFAADSLKKAVDQLSIEDLDDKLILDFLHHLEIERKCSVKTRNVRLAAIRSFFDFISREEPELLQHCRRIRSIPLKQAEHKTVEYLEDDEVQAIFDSVDVNSRNGLRDKALFLFLYNTGARVQEVVDVKISDLHLDTPGKVNLLGKGKKQRACPIWPETVEAIENYIKHREPDDPDEQHLFLNAHGKSITRFGIRHIIKKYTGKASQECSSLNDKKVGPHTFRHSTAMHLIQSGNDINMVKLWLGHADINTTHMYTDISMDLKRKILDSCQAPTSDLKSKTKKWLEPNILKWLKELSKGSQLCGVK